MNVKPTRMELLNTKKKLKLAKKGYKLLKEKRDALMMEFFQTLKTIRDLRKKVAADISQAQQSLFFAQGHLGVSTIDRNVAGLVDEASFDFEVKSIMGVKVPKITNIVPSQEWFSPTDSSAELDNAVVRYRRLFPSLLELIEKQLVLNRLAGEIQKTKRKVNSLENIVVPGLTAQKREISFKLEERAREDFTRLKKIKEKLS